jgi:phosphatidylglycerol---prolipoprotein diacylglyceryl transferase
MQQVLFHIPGTSIPVYGFGVMLFIVFIVTMWLAGRRAQMEGMPRDRVQDLVLWTFLGGLVGARLFFLFQYRADLQLGHESEVATLGGAIWFWIKEFCRIWNGGIVFYGSALGGWLAALAAHRFILKRFNISTWKLADALAPSIAIGLCLGRIGCFLNGCCWGHVACPDAPAVGFPLMTSPAREMVSEFQTSAGFTLDPDAKDPRTVGIVEPDSAADSVAEMKRGDVIIAVNGKPVETYDDLKNALTTSWPRGQKDVILTVRREGKEKTLAPYVPRTIGLFPTQLYESISMFLIFLVLLALYPVRQYDGQLMVVLMLCYAVHRYFNETLRHDTPTYWYALTISQWISVGIFAAGLALHLWRRRYPLGTAAARPAAKKPLSQPA